MPIERTSRTTLKRRAERASYDSAAIHAILDEALIGSLAVNIEGEPQVQPMIHARDGNSIILHGAQTNRMLSALENGARACLNVTLIDGLVLGRSVPDHTFQYRSVSVHGLATPVRDAQAKRAAMEIVFSHIIAGRWAQLPPVDEAYLGHVKVLRLPLDECVAKINTATPVDTPGAVWSGTIPLAMRSGTPLAAAGPQPAIPAEIEHYARTPR